jgi:hypothetical protein
MDIQDSSNSSLFRLDRLGKTFCYNGIDLLKHGADATTVQIRSDEAHPGLYIKGGKPAGNNNQLYIHVTDENDDDVFTVPATSNTSFVTSLASYNTIVRRGDAGEVALKQIYCDSILLGEGNQYGTERTPYIAMYGTSLITHRPYLADGSTQNPDAYWSFGHSPYELFDDYTALNTGITGVEDNNEIFIRLGKTQSTLHIKGEKNYGVSYITVLDEDENTIFSVDRNGNVENNQLLNLDNRVVNNQNWIAATKASDSQAAGDSSLYIGSAKLEFNRAAYQLRHRTLATAHIPKYLSDAGYTAANLPTGKAINDLSCLEWLRSARTFLTLPNLQVDTVFPAANVGVDFGGLVDFPNTGVGTNTTAIGTNTTAIATNTASIAGLGGGTANYAIYVSENDSTYNTAITEDQQHIVWSRNRGSSSGGQMSFMLIRCVTANLYLH